MPDILVKCGTCGAVLDEEDLFCPNCGTEAPTREGETAPTAHITSYNFTCKGCGASMSYDASAGTLRCPFCGSTELEKQPDAKEISPQAVVSFVITQEQAVATMRQWLGSSFWRPGDLSQQAAVVKMTPVYVPYWVFEAQTHTFWTADTSRTPIGACASWYPVTGQHEGTYRALLVGASGALTPAETAALCPFDLAGALPPDKIDLTNSIYERFTVPRKYARPLANQGFEQLEAEACGQYVPGSARNLKVNVRITDLTSQPMLVPVWIMAYRYQDRVFRFLANGQTGRVTGQAPLSWRKIAAVIGIVLLVLLILLLIALGHGGGRRGGFGMQFPRLDRRWYTSVDQSRRAGASSFNPEPTATAPAEPTATWSVRKNLFAAGSEVTVAVGSGLNNGLWHVRVFHGDPSCANKFFNPRLTSLKTIAICARSGCAIWLASARSMPASKSPSMPLRSAASRSGISCSTVPPGSERPPLRPVSRAIWA